MSPAHRYAAATLLLLSIAFAGCVYPLWVPFRILTMGDNRTGQLGTGDFTDRLAEFVPVTVNDKIMRVLAGAGHSLALDSNGTVWSWGANDFLQLGRRTQTMSDPVPAPVLGLPKIRDIFTGEMHSFALDESGQLWVWGSNEAGRAAPGVEPIAVEAPEGTLRGLEPMVLSFDQPVLEVAGGGEHTVVLLKDGSVWAWGSNEFGQLGIPGIDYSDTARKVEIEGVVRIATASDTVLAILADGTVMGWGSNDYGQVGDGTRNDRYHPVKVNGLEKVVSVSCGYLHSMARTKDGRVFVWGANENWQVGEGLGEFVAEPRHIPFERDIRQIAAGGYCSLVADDNGTVWAWGHMFTGKPTQVGKKGAGWAGIAGGWRHVLLLGR